MFGKRILVVGAHPDDIEMNAGGTIHKLRGLGREVNALVLSRHSKLNGIRIEEAKRAQALLRVNRTFFGHGVDTELGEHKGAAIDFADTLVKELEPDTIITHFYADTHQDHVATYEIMAAAGRNVRNFLLFKPTFPSGRTDLPFHPNLVVKLSDDDMDSKMAAMNEFVSQRAKYGDDKWLESLKATAAGDAWTYGGFHGYAELFQVSRLLA